MRADVEYACGVLAEAVERRAAAGRLERALALRQQLLEDMGAGRPGVQENYRYRWLRDTATAVFALVGEASRQFDLDHPDDMATTFDLVDVMERTLAAAKVMHQQAVGGA